MFLLAQKHWQENRHRNSRITYNGVLYSSQNECSKVKCNSLDGI